jgi:hypothetical protein
LKKSVLFSQSDIENSGLKKEEKARMKTGSSGRLAAAEGTLDRDEEAESIGIEEGSEK